MPFRVHAVSPVMRTQPSESPQPRFGDLLRQFRVARGLTQERLAERTGLSVRGISENIDLFTWRGLGTRAGGEVAGEY